MKGDTMKKQEFWGKCRENEVMLIDAPMRKVAIYQGGSGTLVLGVEEDESFTICCIAPDEVSEFVRRVAEVGLDCAAECGRISADMPEELR